MVEEVGTQRLPVALRVAESSKVRSLELAKWVVWREQVVLQLRAFNYGTLKSGQSQSSTDGSARARVVLCALIFAMRTNCVNVGYGSIDSSGKYLVLS